MLMCMCMLNKRMHVMFEEKTFRLLSSLARQEETSIGELVRRAVRTVYMGNRKAEIARRKRMYNKILSLQKRIGASKGIDYRTLIEDGRIRQSCRH